MSRWQGHVVRCGTTHGYEQHRRRKEPTCSDCRTAWAAWNRERRATPEGRKRTRRMNLNYFGCSPERYQILFYAQGGMCAVCYQPETAENQHGRMHLAVDHDHSCCPGQRSCGKCIRALLCSNCNRALGCLGDDAARADNLAAYRRRF